MSRALSIGPSTPGCLLSVQHSTDLPSVCHSTEPVRPPPGPPSPDSSTSLLTGRLPHAHPQPISHSTMSSVPILLNSICFSQLRMPPPSSRPPPFPQPPNLLPVLHATTHGIALQQNRTVGCPGVRSSITPHCSEDHSNSPGRLMKTRLDSPCSAHTSLCAASPD